MKYLACLLVCLSFYTSVAQQFPYKTFKGNNYGIIKIEFNKDGSKLIAAGDASGSLRIWDINSEMQVGYIPISAYYMNFCVFSSNKKYCATITDDHRSLTLFNIETTDKIAQFTAEDNQAFFKANFTPDNKYLVDDVGNFISTITGKIEKKKSPEFARVRGSSAGFNFSPDGKYLIYANWDTLYFNNLVDKRKSFYLPTLSTHKSILAYHKTIYTFAIDSEFKNVVLGMTGDNIDDRCEIAVVDIERKTKSAHISIPLEGIRNVKIAPDGSSFALSGTAQGGSPSATKVMVYSLRNLSPILLLAAHDTKSVGDIAYSPDGSYLATGSYSSQYVLKDGLLRIDVYREGKDIEADAKIWDLPTVLRAENEVSPASTGKVVPKSSNGPQTYAVVVGISNYDDSGIKDLKFANKDAFDYYQFLRSASGGGLTPDNVCLLTDVKATRSNILSELTQKFYKATEDDVIIFYFAGHGQPDPVGEEVYFLGSDSHRDNLVGTAVSQFDVEKVLKRSRAKIKICITDACHSGGMGLESAGMRADPVADTNRLMSEIVKSSNGVVFLSASSSSESSQEDARWGHGVFTYFLLAGLSGNADSDKNGVVTIRELSNYVTKEVAASTKGVQHPELKGNYDNVLPMSSVRK